MKGWSTTRCHRLAMLGHLAKPGSSGFMTRAQTSICEKLGPGPRDWCIVHRISQRSTDRIHCQWTSAVAGIIFQSLTVAAIRDPVWSSFCEFLRDKIYTELRRHLKENGMRKIFAVCHSGAPFQPGALRTCVPCLMVNPALAIAQLSCVGDDKKKTGGKVGLAYTLHKVTRR